MVTLYEFNQLTIKERASLVITNGEFITNVLLDETGYNLYSLNDFYVELVIVDIDVMDVNAFKYGERFDKYLHEIDVIKLWKK